MVQKNPSVRTVTITELRATCSWLLEEVSVRQRTIVVTKQGKPIAQLRPMVARPKRIVGAMKGRIELLGDIVSSVGVRWNALEE